MNGPFLIRIDDAKFADIPNKVVPRTVRFKDPTFESRQAREWIFSGYCEKLLHKNEKLRDLLQQFVGRMDDPECWNRLTQGQRILYSLAALDGQVKNGGITQFFWNCPDLLTDSQRSKLDRPDVPGFQGDIAAEKFTSLRRDQ